MGKKVPGKRLRELEEAVHDVLPTLLGCRCEDEGVPPGTCTRCRLLDATNYWYDEEGPYSPELRRKLNIRRSHD
jgi:hypothetical protein